MRDSFAAIAIAALALAASLGACAHGTSALRAGVVFTRYSPLSRGLEIARRTLAPRTFRRVQQELADKRLRLPEQAIDLSQEKFTVYVPGAAPPPQGYGVLVFVAPWPGPTQPRMWRTPLDRHRLIFVSAEGSGNDANVYERRLPLALLALENVRAQYPIDPERSYIAGFSGGSRVAEIAALAYPDAFRGVLLNAGSEPIDGERGVYLPPPDLFRAFQRTRVVFMTGELDELNLDRDEISQESLKQSCVFDVTVAPAPGLAHQPLDDSSLDRALSALDGRRALDAGELARCNERIQRELEAKLRDAEAAIARGDRDGARARIKAIDARYGGLAAPAILKLDDELAARR